MPPREIFLIPADRFTSRGSRLYFPEAPAQGFSCDDCVPLCQEFLEEGDEWTLAQRWPSPADIAMVVPATMPMATPLVLGAATGAG